MFPLLKQSLLHAVRSRLLLMVLIFSFVIQYLGLQTVAHMTAYMNGVVAKVGPKEAVFVMLFFELFVGAFLAAVFGIWQMPYAHQGPRSGLTFTLPVSKWTFAASYAITILLLIAVQHFVMFLSYGSIFGFSNLFSVLFPWGGFFCCLVLEAIAFTSFAFAFATSSMTFGQIPTFFIGNIVFFLFQVSGALLKINFGQFMTEPPKAIDSARSIYEILPPLGEMVFDLRIGVQNPSMLTHHLVLWTVWLVIFVCLFRWKIRLPAKHRSAEG